MNSKGKEIIFLLSQDLQSPGGLGRYGPMAKELVKQGFSVKIIALHPDYKNLENKKQFVGGFEVNYVSQMHVKKCGNLTTYFPWWKLPLVIIQATARLYRKALEYHPDYVIIGKPHPMNGFAGKWVAKKYNAKLIVDCDDYEKESNHYANSLQKSLVGFFEFYFPRRAWKVTTNTFFMQEKLIKAGVKPEKIVYLSNGVDRDRFSNIEPDKVEKLRQELRLSGKKVVLYIGSLNLANHPVDLLMKAFVLVKDSIPDSMLLVVGGGKDLGVLINLAQDLGIFQSVIFTGRVSSDFAPLYYSLADVTVDPADDSPTSSARAPLKIFESWAMGVPVVTSDIGDRKMLANLQWGPIILTSFSPADFAQAIIRCLGGDFNSMNKYSRDLPFFWDKLIEKSQKSILDM